MTCKSLGTANPTNGKRPVRALAFVAGAVLVGACDDGSLDYKEEPAGGLATATVAPNPFAAAAIEAPPTAASTVITAPKGMAPPTAGGIQVTTGGSQVLSFGEALTIASLATTPQAAPSPNASEVFPAPAATSPAATAVASESVPVADSSADTESSAGSDAGAEPESLPSADSNPDSDAGAGSDSGAGLESVSGSDSNPDSDAGAGSDSDTALDGSSDGGTSFREAAPEDSSPTTSKDGSVETSQSSAEPAATPSSSGSAADRVGRMVSTDGETLGFPGAVGYGRQAKGGRGGRVVIVDTTENRIDANDRRTSLVEALTVERGPRTIVFEVGGIFDMGKSIVKLEQEDDSFVTVACQTAPAPGVVIRTLGIKIGAGAHDVVMRHCAIRGIDHENETLANIGRPITVSGSGTRDVLLDHMSLSWGTDENMMVYQGPNDDAAIERFTLSNSIVAEGDADSNHRQSDQLTDYHSMGPSCNTNNETHRVTGCSIVNNLIAHNNGRNGMLWASSGELVNNIVYNWREYGLTIRPTWGQDTDAIVTNNLMKPGPSSVGGQRNPGCQHEYVCALHLGTPEYDNSSKYRDVDTRYDIGENFFIAAGGSIADAELMGLHQNHAGTDDSSPTVSQQTPGIDIVAAATPGSPHLNCVGASKPARDEIDARVIQEFHDGTGAVGIYDNVKGSTHNSTVQRRWDHYGQPTRRDSFEDRDRDGMADEWESLRGLDPTDGDDHRGDIDGDGYTNLEQYLAELALCD